VQITIASQFNLDRWTFEGSTTFAQSAVNRLTVNLTACPFVDIYAMVSLLTIMTFAVDNGYEVTIDIPTDRGVANYLARMRFFELVPSGVVFDQLPPEVHEHESALVPLTRVDAVNGGEHAIEELANFAYERLDGWVAAPFTEALAEIGINVIHHSDAEVGFVAAQRYGKKETLLFVVGDGGIGIRESLARGVLTARALSDSEALKLAVRQGVTGKPGLHSGVGLSTVLELAENMSIRSGHGLLTKGWGGVQAKQAPGLSGTIVCAEVRER
jgi:hypothetical protein